MTVDLHLHTTASDGSFTPAELVEKAIELDLKTIAITDHDTISGIEEAKLAAADKDIEVIPGIELNTNIFDLEVHILGYYIDYNDLELGSELDRLQNARYDRIKEMVKELQRLSMGVSFNRVLQIANGGALGRVHLARAMVEAGYVSEIGQAFEEYIGKGGPVYVDRYKLDPVMAVELIKSVGGIPVLAHPGLIRKDYLISELVEAGLVGLEVYHSEHDKYDVEHYSALAEEYGLIKTGGSDCHGPDENHILLGTVDVPVEVLANLQELGLTLV